MGQPTRALRCAMRECAEYRVRGDLCFKHWNRYRTEPRPAGPRANYIAIHAKCVSRWGKAAEHPCRYCGRPASDWAYDHLDPAEQWEDGDVYSQSTDYYHALCESCHKRFDIDYAEAVKTRTVDAYKANVSTWNHQRLAPRFR